VPTFPVEVGLVEVDRLQVGDAHFEGAVIDLDRLFEDVGLAFHFLGVHGFDAAGEGLGGFIGLDLELVGVALLAGSLFVADLDEDDLAELAEGGRGRESAAAPERLPWDA